MILEMKVPSPGESIKEVEIATWLVKDGDYVEKDQAIAEVDSDKATLELPAEASGIITLKAEEGDAVAVGAVVCLIDTSLPNPSKGGASKQVVEEKPLEEKKAEVIKVEVKAVAPTSYATSTPSPAAKKILDEKNILPSDIVGRCGQCHSFDGNTNRWNSWF
jgi:2-oxoglutarate dehydrogenase E2 component (dihydrolipoamide succinyltransferase)